jgi:hypothetical protein
MSPKKKALKVTSRTEKKRNPDSPFWIPEKAGDSIAGKFVEYQRTKGFGDQPGLAIVLDCKPDLRKDYIVGLSNFVIKDVIGQVYTRIKKNHKLEFTYLGKSGRTKLFSVKLNGELLKQSGGFGAASENDISSFFPKQ